MASRARVDNRDDWPAAMWALMHCINGHEDGRIADRGSGNGAHCGLRMTMVMNIGIVEHDLAPTTQESASVCLTFDKAVDQSTFEVLGAWPFRQH